MKRTCTNCKKPLGKISVISPDGKAMCLDCGCKHVHSDETNECEVCGLKFVHAHGDKTKPNELSMAFVNEKLKDDFPHRHFPRLKGYVVTDNPEGFEAEIKLMLEEQRRLALEEAKEMVNARRFLSDFPRDEKTLFDIKDQLDSMIKPEV